MIALFKNLKKGMSKAAALQDAQAQTRARHPSPYYWAGFALVGNPE
jgi:CHAT domain-containing protein